MLGASVAIGHTLDTERNGRIGMATYTKRGKRYRIRWRNPGDKNARSHSVPDEQTAREFRAEADRCEARSEPWVPPSHRMQPVEQQDLETLATDWLRDIGRTARAATISAYADSVGRFIEFAGAHIGGVPVLTDLTPETVKAFDASLESRRLTVYTRRSRVAAVKSWAGWIESMHPEVFSTDLFRWALFQRWAGAGSACCQVNATRTVTDGQNLPSLDCTPFASLAPLPGPPAWPVP